MPQAESKKNYLENKQNQQFNDKALFRITKAEQCNTI